MAAPASDLPENMIDSPILRALEYTGYDVQQQKDDGTLYQSGSYGSRIPSGILSGINYGTALSGKETVADSSTITGLAPDIAKFKHVARTQDFRGLEFGSLCYLKFERRI